MLKSLDGLVQPVDFVLQAAKLRGDLPKLIRILEAGGAAVGCVEARKIEVTASLTWCLSVAFDLPSLALVTSSE